MLSCHAHLTVDRRKSDGAMIATEIYATYPLRLHVCEHSNNYHMTSSVPKSLSVYLLSHGGGLVAGDDVALNIKVKEGASLCATSFSTAKAFKPKVSYSEAPNDGKDNNWIKTKTTCSVGKGGLLALCPQPTQCFRNSFLEQKNTIMLDPSGSSSLLLVDWYTGGRANLDNGLWQMNALHSVTEVMTSANNNIAEEPQLLFRDSTQLSGGKTLSKHMRGYNVVAMVLLVGPRVKTVTDRLLKLYCARSKFVGLDENVDEVEEGLNEDGLFVSCGPLVLSKEIDDGIIVRLCTHSIEQAGMYNYGLANSYLNF